MYRTRISIELIAVTFIISCILIAGCLVAGCFLLWNGYLWSGSLSIYTSVLTSYSSYEFKLFIEYATSPIFNSIHKAIYAKALYVLVIFPLFLFVIFFSFPSLIASEYKLKGGRESLMILLLVSSFAPSGLLYLRSIKVDRTKDYLPVSVA